MKKSSKSFYLRKKRRRKSFKFVSERSLIILFYILKLERAAVEITNLFTWVSLFGVPLGLISSNNLAVFVFMDKTKIFNWEKEHTYHPKLLLNKWNKKTLKEKILIERMQSTVILQSKRMWRGSGTILSSYKKRNFAYLIYFKKIHHKAASVSSGVFVIKEKSEKSCSTE